MVTAKAVVTWVASYGLPDHTWQVTDRPLEADTWEPAFSGALRQRLIGHLQAAVRDGALPVTDEQREAVEDAHLAACASALKLDRRLIEAASTLTEAGIDLLVLKGVAAAHLIYPRPELRSYGDIDVLFRSEQFDAALSVLSRMGYVRPLAQARPGFDRRFGKGATLHGQDGVELDTHRNLVFGTFGFAIDLDELFDSASTFELGGLKLRALGPETRLMHACYHAALGDPDPRFGSIRDVAQLLAAGDFETLRVLTLARQWQARAVLARAFALCHEHLGVEVGGPLVDTLRGYEPTARERRAIASYVGPNRHFAAKVVASLPYLDSMRDKLAFLGATALPSRQFAESRGDEPGLRWIRRGLRSLLQGGAR